MPCDAWKAIWVTHAPTMSALPRIGQHACIGFTVNTMAQAFMPAQIRNVAEAALRPLPSTDVFFARLAQTQEPKPPPPHTQLYGNMFAKAPSSPSNTERLHAARR